MKAIVGATLIDGAGREPIPGATVLIEGERVLAAGRSAEVGLPADAETVDATGRWVIPGLMDANVHVSSFFADVLVPREGSYEEIVEEGAQITLQSGVTTIFDTYGHLGSLLAVRDRIDRGEAVGSRMFVAGNIVGLDGPLSKDFFPSDSEVERDTFDRINAQWVNGTGSELQWLPPEGVRDRVRAYIEAFDLDFLKYAATGHGAGYSRFLTFTEEVQRVIVEEGHRAGLTVQPHTTTVESLRLAIDVGVDLLQHPNSTGMVPIPDSTIRTMVERAIPAATLAYTDEYLAWNERSGAEAKAPVKDLNCRRFIEAGVTMLLTTDGFVVGPGSGIPPVVAAFQEGAPNDPYALGDAHFLWLESVVERGMRPMDALLAATRNVAEAYGQAADLGTLEAGKRADLLLLEGDPLADPRNYRRIAEVVKDGAVVDRAVLPIRRVLTAV
jgi:imidazolonepropionase-like amidohydrolase